VGGHVTPPPPAFVAEAPRIEAVFVLDTTGSMSGLIEGAKQKIWSIADEMVSAQNSPDLQLGLVGYRDRGDRYVTRRFDLTQDIDQQYANLCGFEAAGGGDGPESVNQALHEAVTKMRWSSDPDVYRVIFLVGDAPPHMDYQDDVPFHESIRLARDRDIVVNTIQCGNQGDTARVWQEMASLSQGHYAAIAQDGGIEIVSTPMDERLAELNRKLSETVVAYGAAREKVELESKLERAASAPAALAASRLSFFSKKGGVLNSGRRDLVDAITGGEVALEDVPETELPAEMVPLSSEERGAYVAERQNARARVQAEIDALVADRDAFLEVRAGEREAEGKADAFDDKVRGSLHEQAAKKGIVY